MSPKKQKEQSATTTKTKTKTKRKRRKYPPVRKAPRPPPLPGLDFTRHLSTLRQCQTLSVPSPDLFQQMEAAARNGRRDLCLRMLQLYLQEPRLMGSVKNHPAKMDEVLRRVDRLVVARWCHDGKDKDDSRLLPSRQEFRKRIEEIRGGRVEWESQDGRRELKEAVIHEEEES